jgi:hypothetical protein
VTTFSGGAEVEGGVTIAAFRAFNGAGSARDEGFWSQESIEPLGTGRRKAGTSLASRSVSKGLGIAGRGRCSPKKGAGDEIKALLRNLLFFQARAILGNLS